MKILKSMFAIVGLFFTITSCSDWGQADEPAGNQIYPTRQVVATYPFEYKSGDVVFSDIDTSDSSKIKAVEDNDRSSNVLHIDSTGYARIANPLNSVKLQNGVAITMWVKTAAENLSGALFSFGYNNADSARFYFTPNAQIVYSKPGQLTSLNLDENDPETYKTGAISAGKWHLVALQITTTGYQLYVDGKKSVSDDVTNPTSTSFNYATLVNFINKAPYMYIGKGADSTLCESWYDDINIIRNQMVAKDWTPVTSSGEGTFEYVVGDKVLEIGSSDNTTAWWTAFSNYYRIPTESTMHFRFVNHTSGANNWNNWNLALTTDADRGGTGYAEYAILRSDLYGWGDSNFSLSNISSSGYDGWDAFRTNMEGATVDVTIKRSGAKINITAVATCTNGKVYTENYSQTCGDGKQVVRAFFICDSSHLVFDESGCFVQTASTVSTTTVGTEDNTAAWWTAFTDYFSIPKGQSQQIEFTNHTSGANNWNNWNFALATDADRGGTGYAEYFVLRSDLYGWGDSNYNAANIASDGYDGWDAFRTNMEGAKVTITITRSGSDIAIKAVATCTNGKVYTEKYHQTCGDGSQTVRAFLICDSSHFVMDSDNCYLLSPLYQ